MYVYICLLIYLRKGEGESEREREAEADSALSKGPNVRLSPTTRRWGPEPKPRVGFFANLSPQTPRDTGLVARGSVGSPLQVS